MCLWYFTQKVQYIRLVSLSKFEHICVLCSFYYEIVQEGLIETAKLVAVKHMSKVIKINSGPADAGCVSGPECKRKMKWKQGKSEGFESCDWPKVRKRPIWVKIGDVLYRVTLKFDGWPWKKIGHLSFAVSSFMQHFIAIGEFKLELQSGNAQFGSHSTIFRAVWPWN